ncbi:hypothetical protein BBP40_006008, partial [Aspergillus hancockii]
MALRAIVGGLILAAAVQATADTSCCQSLSRALPNEVFSPSNGSDTYTKLNNARWSDTTILSPGCIFQPKSAKDVARGLKVLVNKKCQFAIKSGGHNPNPGANNINGGVSIDVGLLNGISLAPDRSSVSLGAGSTWGAAYDKFTGEEGLLFPGGLCGTTGVGGVSLGGGQSYLLAKLGWVVDSVLNYEVVLASGDIVNANQKSHPDLFKALKGGGSNFGIVTRADIATFEQTDIWAGQVITPALPATVEAALHATTNFTEQANFHPDAGAQVIFTYTNGSAVIISSIASNDGTENPEPLQAFTALQPQLGNTVSRRSMSNVVKELDSHQASGYRDATATITFVNDYATLAAVQNITAAVYAHIQAEVPTMDFILFLVPMPKITETYAAARGGNAL